MASNKNALAMCDDCGFVYPHRVMKLNSYRMLNCPTCFDGAYDLKNGSIQNGERIFLNSRNIYKPKIYGGVAEKESTDLLKSFFKRLRRKS